MDILTYHYVRPDVARPPGGYYRLDLDDFRRQLDHLGETRGFVDRGAFLDAVRGRTPPPDDGVVLSFDDGLADHHEWVLPELESRGLWGLFFVPAGPYRDGRTLAVHRVHALLGRVPIERLDAALAELGVAGASGGDGNDREGEVGESGGGYRRYGDDPSTAVKRSLNFEIPYARLDATLTALEGRFGGPPDPRTFYLSPDQLRALADAGMVLGAHSVTHRVLSRLPPDEQRAEVRGSFDALSAVAGEPPVRLFAYPYGGPGTFDGTARAALRAVGCRAAFTTVPGPVTARHLREERFALPRRDCNEFPHGTASHRL